MSAKRLRRAFFIGALLLGTSLFLGLGIWQLQRREWKTNLIEQVEERRNAPPAAAPGRDAWNNLSSDKDAYRHVILHGSFQNDHETLVEASTSEGSGFWVLTPLQSDQGFTVLVNRGFVPPDHRDPATRAEGQSTGPVTVTGLLRMTEPKGRFLRTNDPSNGRWYTRDVAAIATARQLTDAAPYFVDADATPNPDGWPIGGLTVVAFPNHHLIYAVTWFGLALLTLIAAFIVWREEIEPL